MKSFIVKLIKPSFKEVADKITMEPIFRPYMITDDKERVEMLITANGGKALISQEASVQEADLVADPKEDFEKIKIAGISDQTPCDAVSWRKY